MGLNSWYNFYVSDVSCSQLLCNICISYFKCMYIQCWKVHVLNLNTILRHLYFTWAVPFFWDRQARTLFYNSKYYTFYLLQFLVTLQIACCTRYKVEIFKCMYLIQSEKYCISLYWIIVQVHNRMTYNSIQKIPINLCIFTHTACNIR